MLFYLNAFAWAIAAFLVTTGPVLSQSHGGASRIYTDFSGFWTSAVGAINPVQPDDSHHLLGFTWQGTVYSTGVNDAQMTLQGVSYSPQVYQAFPVRNVVAKSSGTYIGLGQLYDGVDDAISSPAPFPIPPNLAGFLTDGLQGLDYGTGVANVAAGNVIFDFSGIIDPLQIGDGIPDILVTQFANPSGTLDEIFLTDELGNQVGNSLTINHNGIAVLGQWIADFYELHGNSAAFINESRDLRLWVADLESFGITLGNYESVRSLRYRLNGSSDLAFAAYKVGVFDIVAANNDEGVTRMEEPLVLNVLENDLPEGLLDPAFLTILAQPANGTVSVDTNTGSISYTPNPEFFGWDQFTYEICGAGGLQCDEALVTIEVEQIFLPVVLSSFSGTVLAGKGVALHWTTSSEKDASHFQIQSSTDGKNWVVQGKVQGAGAATTTTTYRHFLPLSVNERLFFRLKQVDRNGNSSYSEVWAANFEQSGNRRLRVYPNPSDRELWLDGGVSCGEGIRVFDLFGREKTDWVRHTTPSPCLNRLEIDRLPRGIYIGRMGQDVFRFEKN
ncbi:Ig-like domain-containing protein [Cyclobacterium xiamenense]|uniref:Ig-like domain-containing protein n=1 Tax=Cyclobacterium xiamenense TaxID=1297121 RepID=UPI0035CED4D2